MKTLRTTMNDLHLQYFLSKNIVYLKKKYNLNHFRVVSLNIFLNSYDDKAMIETRYSIIYKRFARTLLISYVSSPKETTIRLRNDKYFFFKVESFVVGT